MIIADDFGLDPAHDRVILELLKCQAIDGTSVMVRTDFDHTLINELLAVQQSHRIQIGLHLNLTDTLPGFERLGSILSLWAQLITGRIKTARIDTIFDDQLSQFITQFGKAPDFIDGHQHCHAIGGNWPALKALCDRLKLHSSDIWVRSPAGRTLTHAVLDMKHSGLKAGLVTLWGWRLRRRLNAAHILTNHDFSGFAPFNRPDRYRDIFHQIIQAKREDCVMMVHPGADDAERIINGHPNRLRALEAEILKNA